MQFQPLVIQDFQTAVFHPAVFLIAVHQADLHQFAKNNKEKDTLIDGLIKPSFSFIHKIWKRNITHIYY